MPIRSAGGGNDHGEQAGSQLMLFAHHLLPPAADSAEIMGACQTEAILSTHPEQPRGDHDLIRRVPGRRRRGATSCLSSGRTQDVPTTRSARSYCALCELLSALSTLGLEVRPAQFQYPDIG